MDDKLDQKIAEEHKNIDKRILRIAKLDHVRDLALVTHSILYLIFLIVFTARAICSIMINGVINWITMIIEALNKLENSAIVFIVSLCCIGLVISTIRYYLDKK